MKFDLNPDLTMAKQVSTSKPKFAGGGDHPTPKSDAATTDGSIVTTKTDSNKFAHGGSGHMFGKSSVKPAKSGIDV